MALCKITYLYKPTVIAGSMPETNPHSVTSQDNITLTQGANVLTIFAPNLQNSIAQSTNKLIREEVYSDPIWATLVNHVFTFTGLCDTAPEDILAFLRATIGLPITYVDYLNNVWVGYILNPEERMVFNAPDSASLSLNFEAERI